MSMRDYAVYDYGLLIDEETMKTIISKLDIELEDDDYMDLEYILYEEGICEYISEFTGEAQAVNDQGYCEWGCESQYYSSDKLVYVQASNYPTLFKKAYDNMEELVDEFKLKLSKYLPEDFDYRSRICQISGTYFG